MLLVIETDAFDVRHIIHAQRTQQLTDLYHLVGNSCRRAQRSVPTIELNDLGTKRPCVCQCADIHQLVIASDRFAVNDTIG